MGKKHIGNKNRHPETSRPARPACRFFLPPINKTKGLWMFSSRVNFLGRSGALAGAIALLASCGGGGGGGGGGGVGVGLLPIVAPPPVVTHTVGGSVTGLVGALVLQNNAGDDLKLSADGKFTFATRVTEGAAYEVSVRTQPLWQFCIVSKGSGKAAADVADVAVACSAAAAQVSTWAGSDTTGSADGHGTSATFETPLGLVVDKSGGLIVSDPINGLLRKISPTGDVSTFAGMAGANWLAGRQRHWPPSSMAWRALRWTYRATSSARSLVAASARSPLRPTRAPSPATARRGGRSTGTAPQPSSRARRGWP
jgi:hypothetical protein